MSCFFPPIFKKNTYKKVRFFTVSSLILIAVLLFSGCRAVRTVASAPFKAIGWGANKVGEVVGGKSTTETVKNGSEGTSGANIDGSEHVLGMNSGVEINFVPLILWGIMLVVFALIVRALVNRYVEKDIQ